VYAADERGVWTAGIGEVATDLSRDGRYLVLFKCGFCAIPETDAGKPMILCDIRARRRYSTRLPRELTPKGSSYETVYFDDKLAVTFEFGGGDCLSWSQSRGWEESRHPLSRLKATGTDRDVSSFDEESAGHPSLVVLGPDGWNARRTVWIRPDGSTQEILRDNSVFTTVAALAVFSPVGLLTASPYYLLAWQGAFEPLSPRNGDQTPADLQRKAEDVLTGRLAASRPSSSWPTTQCGNTASAIGLPTP
jgi:hypothetical protein